MATTDSVPRRRSRRSRRSFGPTTDAAAWWLGPLPLAAAGAALYWAAFEPLGWSLLGWLAPVPWLLLVRSPQSPASRGRFYLAVWLGSAAGWLAMLQGIRLPYWALYFGWLALSFYAACYLPLFVAMTRVAVHRRRWPLWVAAPVAWMGLELARGYLATGFPVGLLAHTQSRWPGWIQTADLGGAYLVSGLMMLIIAATTVSACERRLMPVGVAGITLIAALGYGAWRLQTAPQGEPIGRVALLQGSFDTVFEYNPQRNWETFEQYYQLALRAAAASPPPDVIVWPESTFTGNNPQWEFQGEPALPAGWTTEELVQRRQEFRARAAEVARRVQPLQTDHVIWQVVGAETQVWGDQQRHYNSAILLDEQGRSADRYDKMHLVMFGEYVPLADRIEWLRQHSPIHGVSAGQRAKVLQAGRLALVPNICFESTVPHLIRRQLRELPGSPPPHALVNLTHDGWFWGSSILDLHQDCGVFRAIEQRMPLLVAANPGLTYATNGSGRIVAELPRYQVDVLAVDVRTDGRWSLYRAWGDLPGVACLLLLIAMLRWRCPFGRSAPDGNSESR